MRYTYIILIHCIALCLLSARTAHAMGLMLEPSAVQCIAAAPSLPTPPAAAAKRLAGSRAVAGTKDIAWAWLGSPTLRYPHKALGSATHAGTLHVLVAGDVNSKDAKPKERVYTLPLHKVFEDLTVRLADLDGDGRDEIIVIESDAVRGAATVVLGLRDSGLVELARSPYAGSTFLWLNPVGVADFDSDGKLDIASVITPHIGGILTLYHYRPPKLEPFARAMDTSNHRMGDPEQDLAVIVELPGVRPTIIVPDMGLKALHALRWEASTNSSTSAGETGKWKELADVKPLPARVQRMVPTAGGACVLLANGNWLRVTLSQ